MRHSVHTMTLILFGLLVWAEKRPQMLVPRSWTPWGSAWRTFVSPRYRQAGAALTNSLRTPFEVEKTLSSM